MSAWRWLELGLEEAPRRLASNLFAALNVLSLTQSTKLYSRLYSRGQATCQGGNEDEQDRTPALARKRMGLTMAQKMTWRRAGCHGNSREGTAGAGIRGAGEGDRLKKEMPKTSVMEKAEKTFPASWDGGKYESGI